MTTPSSQEVTGLLLAWRHGDQAALEQLTPLVYQELRRLAARYMRRENPGHTLQTSALVNEAYLRLIDQREVSWQNRAHFFAISAQLMRRILADFATSLHSFIWPRPAAHFFVLQSTLNSAWLDSSVFGASA